MLVTSEENNTGLVSLLPCYFWGNQECGPIAFAPEVKKRPYLGQWNFGSATAPPSQYYEDEIASHLEAILSRPWHFPTNAVCLKQ